MKKILVIAPHMDDETLGCAGTLLRHKSEGDQIHIVLASKLKINKQWSKRYVKKKCDEYDKVLDIFKFKSCTKFNYEPSKIDQLNLSDVVEDFNNLFLRIKPNYIYCPFINDTHSDHQIIAKSAMSASKWFRQQSINKIFMYETLSETNFNFVEENVFKPNFFVDISKYMERKLKISSIYKTEMNKHPFPRSKTSIKALAQLRGSQSGFKFAEAFQLIFSKK